MGFFSKLTADTNETIPSIHVAQSKPAYLLQPNGQKPIEECFYEGYGEFGGIDWFVWLAKVNAETLKLDLDSLSEDELRNIGIGIDSGRVLKDVDTGEFWLIFHPFEQAVGDVKVNYFKGTYAEVIPELGDSANNLTKSGRLVEVPIYELNPSLHSIKISHNPDAVYEDLPASPDCPYQGFFLPESMLESGDFTVDLDNVE